MALTGHSIHFLEFNIIAFQLKFLRGKFTEHLKGTRFQTLNIYTSGVLNPTIKKGLICKARPFL
jgi:hypothetical protein